MKLQLPAPGNPSTLLKALTPQDSWLKYHIRTEYREKPNIIKHKPLPDPAKLQALGWPQTITLTAQPPPPPYQSPNLIGASAGTVAGQLVNMGNGSSGIQPGYDGLPLDQYQLTAAPDRMVILRGHAARIGWQVPIPQLTMFGGQQPVVIYQAASPGGMRPAYSACRSFGPRGKSSTLWRARRRGYCPCSPTRRWD